MTTLPAQADLDNAATQGVFKGAIGVFRTFIADLLGTDSADKDAVRTALGFTAIGNSIAKATDAAAERVLLEFPGAIVAGDAGKRLLVNAAGAAFVLSEAPSGFINKIVNGNFSVNQLAVTGTVVLTAGQYGHDQWKAGATGCTYTFATVANVTTLTISAGTLQQTVEVANLLPSDMVLSWSGTATGEILSLGSGASPRTGSLAATVDVTVEFGTGTLSKVQFEEGSVATPFAARSAADEIILCERYFQKSYPSATAPGAASSQPGAYNFIAQLSTQADRWHVPLRTTMRAAPTITLYSSGTGAAGNFRDEDAVADIAGLAHEIGDRAFSMYPTANFTAGNQMNVHWVADARI